MNRRRSLSSVRWTLALPVVALALMGPAGTHPLGEAAYSITDLGTLGGDASEATGINNQGGVVGWSATAGGETHAFLYAAGTMTDLGTLPGGTSSRATGINDAGQVVGFAGINEHGPGFQEFTQGFIWQDGSMQALGALYCPCTFNKRYGTSAAFGVNAAGQVVGDSETVRGEAFRHAFLWEGGAMQDIGGGAGSFSISVAYGINGTGQVVGSFDGRAFLWQNGERRDLGTLPGHSLSTARAINSFGQVVGESVAVDGEAVARAVVWEGDTVRDLGTLPGDLSSRARGINGTGQVVGESFLPWGGLSRAVLWKNGAAYDLNTLISPGSGWILTSAAAINDAGQIVGAGLRDGRPRAFLLTPGTPSGVWGVLPGPTRFKG
jgi:probable HAF family extracellular repeat protein